MNSRGSEREITTGEFLYWLEFGCWTSVAISPFLYLVNGSAVSTDQLVVRITVFSLALIVAISLRLRKIRHRIRRRGEEDSEA